MEWLLLPLREERDLPIASASRNPAVVLISQGHKT
jgi:hypothetical protein